MSNWISKNAYLTMQEIRYNGSIIANMLIPEGWTLNAVCGMLANMQCESNVNPGIWQGLNYGNMSGGFGLVQWTPATKYINWCKSTFGETADYTNGDYQISRILWELQNGEQWGGSPTGMSFREFTQSTRSAYELAVEFLLAYERPLDHGPSVQAYRGGIGNDWWEYFGGTVPDIPEEPDPIPEGVKIEYVISGNGTVEFSNLKPASGETVYIYCHPITGSATDSIFIVKDTGDNVPYIQIDKNTFCFNYDGGILRIEVYFRSYGRPPIWLLARAAKRSVF